MIGMLLLVVGRLIYLQVVETKYARMADANAVVKKIVYPGRGIIYDRKGKSILGNDALYDLVVTPANVKRIDTARLCTILQIDKTTFQKKIVDAIVKNGRVRTSVFVSLLPPDVYGRLQENMYLFQPGFELVQRQIRTYPYAAAAGILGYIGEISPKLLDNPTYKEYQMGDYLGMTGLEKSYENILMGKRGIQYLVKDNLNRPQGPYENGDFDSAAVAGKNLHLSLDITLQQLGEKLMSNKIGSIVAIDPKTGGILSMVSSPTFDPNLLTGPYRSANFSRLYRDTTKPLFNRATQAMYPPGSTFKPMIALVALDEGVITPSFGYACNGAYFGCSRMLKCTHHNVGHAADLRTALANSCNAYFSHVYRMSVDAQQFGGIKTGGLQKWSDYMSSFGFGHRLGVDIPSEYAGLLPNPGYYDKRYNGSWNSCTSVFLGIGQGELLLTPLQMANAMCIVANKGYYYTPHFVQRIDNDTSSLLARYQEKHQVAHIADASYDAVINGMVDVVNSGGGKKAQIPGIVVGGKTGTAENYAIIEGVHTKQQNHSLFVAFAPAEDPQIAIAVIVENSGAGNTYAAPIASLMMEQYLKDSIPDNRQELVKRMTATNTIPQAMRMKSKLDSLNRKPII
jgi:penicillin-binding protein 2